MSASILPQELLELAMEQLLDDKHALAQCSRVCHQWSCASSRYLFRKLRLRPHVQQQSQYDWYEVFLLGLQKSPRMCASVRELVLTAERGGGQPVSTGVPACSGPVLQHILACLSRLRVFEMSHIDFAGSSKTSEFARGLPPLANPLKLERVQLSNVLGFSTHCGRIDECGTPDSFGLAEFLNIFEEIQELHLDNGALPFMYPVTWHLLEARPKPLGRPLQQPLRLARVHLTGQHSTMALGVLQHMIDMRALKGLSLQLSLPVVLLADEFLSHASRLEHAHITLRRDLASAHEHVVPALACCSRLRTLRISTIAFLPGYTRSDDLLWQRAVDILQCAPASLQRVILDIVLPPIIDAGAGGAAVVKDLDWGVFNAMLARAVQLEEVLLLAAHRCPWTQPMQAAVQSKLSHGAQKLLQFGTFIRS